MALFNNNRNNKGTGFTNVNRILTANQGNKLGETVGSGVQGQATDVRTDVQKSQQNFDQEAQKNRLDTEEAKTARDNVIGRFEEKNFTPDVSKFKVSSGLSDQYNQNKTALQTQQAAQQKAANEQRASIQARIDADRNKLTGLQTAEQKRVDDILKLRETDKNAGFQSYALDGGPSGSYDTAVLGDVKSLGGAGLDASIGSLKGLLGTYNTSAAAENKAIMDKLAGLESQYGEMSTAEKNAWIQSERDKEMTKNLPTEQELLDFTKYRTGTYAGPQELGDFQTLLGKASQVEQLGGLTRSTGGRQELLRRFVGDNDYTQGQQKLDTMLLGQNGTELNQARKATRGLEGDTIAANAQASNLADEYTNRAKIFGNETVKKLGDVRNPLNTQIDNKVKALQEQEAQRSAFLKNMQNTILGKDKNTKNMSDITRLGIGLQNAANSGSLSAKQVEQLLGDKGLISKAEKLKLNTNNLISERLKDNKAQNINRTGVASNDQKARMTSLDRLLGKQGADLEFDNKNAKAYKAGNIGFDDNSLKSYLDQVEGYNKKPAKGGSVGGAAGSVSPLGQIIGGAGQVLNGGSDAGGLGALATLGAGGALGAYGAGAAGGNMALGAAGGAGAMGPAAAAVMLGMDTLNKGDSTAKTLEGGVQMGSGAYKLGAQGRNKVLEGLMKLNVGGNSIANTPGGKQLAQLVQYGQQLEDKGIGELTKQGMNYADGFRDLTKTGRIDQALAKLTGVDGAKNIAGNVGREVSNAVDKAFNGGETGNWGTNEYNTIDSTSGKKVKVGTYANKSSADILKQMLSPTQMRITNSYGNGGAEGSKQMNELLKYYNAALKREKGK